MSYYINRNIKLEYMKKLFCTIETIEPVSTTARVYENGQIILICDGLKYNLNGQQIGRWEW